MAFSITSIQNEEMEVFGNKGVINEDKRLLLIGLGGTGTDALLVAKNTILNRFKLNDGKVPGNIEFLAIDTDESILGKKSGTATIPQNDFILLNDPMITANLHNKTKLPDFYKNWVNPTLTAPAGAGNQGAGAIRQVGRYLLVSNYGTVIEKINFKIQGIMKAAPHGSLIDIIILSGISGGTGSGTFIDMGYIARKACQNLVIGNMQKQITAYLFLPDANEFNPNVPEAAKECIRVNGYAAMKDLDYFMSIPEKKKVSAGDKAETTYKFRQQYGYNEAIESDEAPFDATYLIAGQSDVLHPMPDAYEYAINISADSIVNFIAGSTAAGHTGTAPMGVAAVDINGAAMQAANAGFTKPDGKAQLGIYNYKIMGASMATLPMKEITDYIAGLFLKKIDVLKNQLPNATDYDNFYKAIGLNVVEPNIMTKVGVPNPGFTGADLASNPANEQAMMQNLNRQVATAAGNIPQFVEAEITQLESRIMKEINNYFSNINKGPFFANRIMADGKLGIIAKLRNIATQLNTRAAGFVQEEQKLKQAALARKAEADNSHFGRAAKYQGYIGFRAAQAEQRVRGEVCKALAKRIDDTQALGRNVSLVDTMVQKNKGVFDTYSVILSSLAERFADGGKVAVNRTGKTFMWDIVSIKDIEPAIKNAIDDNDLDTKMNAMLLDMVKESAEWCNDRNTIHKFGEFISQGFQGVLSTSMDKYLETIPPENLTATVRTLDSSAEEHFPRNIAVNVGQSNIFNRVTVPTNAPMMQNVIETYLQGKGITAPPQTSLLCERISWTRVSIGVPMFLYAYLPKYEKAYKDASAKSKIGLHLYDNEGVCGRDYPALLPGMFYDSNFKNEAEEERRARLAALFDKAEALGLVNYEQHAASIKVSHEDWCGKEAEAILAKYKIDRNDIYGSIDNLSQITECRNEVGKIVGRMEELAEIRFIYLPDSTAQDNHDDTVWYARESFCRMPEAEAPLKAEIAKIESVNEVTAELDKISEAFKKEKDYYLTYIYAFVFDVMKKQGTKYVYTDGEEELEIVKMFKNPVWRWEAFQTFNSSLRETESENIQAKLEEATNSDEEMNRVKTALEDILTSVSGTESASLDQLSHDDPRYEPASEFYKKLKAFVKVELSEYQF